MSPKQQRRRQRPTSSATDFSDETRFPDYETTALTVRNEPGPTIEATVFTPPSSPPAATSGPSTGRTWPDLIAPYSSNPQYLYLAAVVAIPLAMGVTGHISTAPEQAATGVMVLLAWLITWIIQRR